MVGVPDEPACRGHGDVIIAVSFRASVFETIWSIGIWKVDSVGIAGSLTSQA